MAQDEKLLVANRAAFHEYIISDKYEAGIALTGTEVKSVMEGRVQLKDSYVSVRDGEAWLFNAHISPYSHGNRANHDPTRTRKLLLHRREIDRLEAETTTKGMTLVVTRVYLKNRHVKVEVGVARGSLTSSIPRPPHPRRLSRQSGASFHQRLRSHA